MDLLLRIECYCHILVRGNECIIMTLHLHSLAVCSPCILLTPWSMDIVKKLIVVELVNKVSAFMEHANVLAFS